MKIGKVKIHKSDTGLFYDGIPIHAAQGLHEYVANLVDQFVKKNSHILELGAGSGALTQRLIDEGFIVTPVDLDGHTWASKSVSPLLLDLNSADWSDNVGDNTPECILAVEIIEHLDNPHAFITCLYEKMEKGGVCIITTPNVTVPESVFQFLKNGNLFGFSPTQYYQTGHISILPWWLLKILCEDAGFSVEEISFCGMRSGSALSVFIKNRVDRLVRLVRRWKGVKYVDDGVITTILLKKL